MQDLWSNSNAYFEEKPTRQIGFQYNMNSDSVHGKPVNLQEITFAEIVGYFKFLHLLFFSSSCVSWYIFHKE